MYAYELAWYANDGTDFCTGGSRTILHFKGFKYREQMERFIARLKKQSTFVRLICIDDHTQGTRITF